jgi:hypothetical protein
MTPQLLARLLCLTTFAVAFQIATARSATLPACSAAISPGPENLDVLAQVRPLSGAALEQACRDYATRALSDSQEWESLKCSAKLGMSPQLFSLDYNVHFNRCKTTLGTNRHAY